MKKNILIGLVSLIIGVVVYSRAESLTIVKDGKTYPNEGGYIRSKIIGSLLVIAGVLIISFPRWYGVSTGVIK